VSQCPTGVADSESRRARPPRSGGFLALPFSSSQDRARPGRLGLGPANAGGPRPAGPRRDGMPVSPLGARARGKARRARPLTLAT
jgi:hypothetical protein